MRYLKILISWQFWLSLLFMGGIVYGLYEMTFISLLHKYTNHNQEVKIPQLLGMNVNQAIKKLDSLGLKYEVDSIRFDENAPPNSIIEFYPMAGFSVKKGRRVFIKSNPRTWRPVQLPDIVSKSKRLAFTQLKISGLEVGDTIYEADIAKDAVLRVMFRGKEIPPGELLPRFSKVDVVLGKGLEYGVSMPSLIGMTLEQAKQEIQINMFELGMLQIEGNITDSANARVFYQFPLARDNYDQGLPVDLWVSDEPKDSLKLAIQVLDRQFRNFGENDSIAVEKYARELELSKKASTAGLTAEQREQTKENPTIQTVKKKPIVRQKSISGNAPPEGVVID